MKKLFTVLLATVMLAAVLSPAAYADVEGYAVREVSFYKADGENWVKTSKLAEGPIKVSADISMNSAMEGVMLILASYEDGELADVYVTSGSGSQYTRRTRGFEAEVNVDAVTQDTKLKCFIWTLGSNQPISGPYTLDSVSHEAKITSFTLEGEGIHGSYIMHPTDEPYKNYPLYFDSDRNLFHEGRVVVFHEDGADLTNLEPQIEVSEGASISPEGPQDFSQTEEVVYTVTAEDGTQQTYTVKTAQVRTTTSKIWMEDFENVTPGAPITTDAANKAITVHTHTEGLMAGKTTDFSSNLVLDGVKKYVQFVQNPEGGKSLKIMVEDATESLTTRFPAGSVQLNIGAAGEYAMIGARLKYERPTEAETSTSYVSFLQVATILKIFIVDDGEEIDGVPYAKVYTNAVAASGSLNASEISNQGYLGMVKVGEFFDIDIVVKLGTANAKLAKGTDDVVETNPEVYYYLNGQPVESATGYVYSNRPSINSTALTISRRAGIYFDEIRIFGGPTKSGN